MALFFNLVFLVQSPARSNAFPKLVDTVPDGVEVDLKRNKWRIIKGSQCCSNHWRSIGKPAGKNPAGCLGVFDRINFHHLNAMTRHIAKIMRR
jgi:hypothetical protein